MRFLYRFIVVLVVIFTAVSCSKNSLQTMEQPSGDADQRQEDEDNDRDDSTDDDFAVPDTTDSDTYNDVEETEDEAVTDNDAEDIPEISNVTVEKNPNSVLSCFISWDTEVPTASEVHFFAPDTPVFSIRDDQQVTHHRLLIFGMKQNRTYTLSVVNGTTEQDAAFFTTESLPPHLLHPLVTVNQEEKTFHGWTIFTMNSGIYKSGGLYGTPNPDFPVTVVALNMNGDVVWYSVQSDMTTGDTRYYPKRGLISTTTMRLAHFQSEPAYREVDWAGNIVVNDPQQPSSTTVDNRYHHVFERRPNGHLWTLQHHMKKIANGSNPIQQVLGDNIVEMDAQGSVLWKWNLFDYETPDLSDRPATEVVYDWSHCNNIWLTPDNGTIYLNSRHLSTLFKIDRATGDVLWRFGDGRDFEMLGDFPDPWFHYSHATKLLPNGHLLMYDNGNDVRNYSRAIEYEINEEDMTASVVWSYGGPGSELWQTTYWGDADRLPNGNTLICAGNFDRGTVSAIKEVTKEGEKVWEIIYPSSNPDIVYGIYNAERIIPPIRIVH